jgi:hypothetical protein
MLDPLGDKSNPRGERERERDEEEETKVLIMYTQFNV